MIKKILFSIITIILLTTHISLVFASGSDSSNAGTFEFTGTLKNKIEKFVQKEMKSGKIPGMSVVIVKDDNVIYKKGFGFSNIQSKKPVTTDTLFELGSTSKAFTGLGISLLEDSGKIRISDNVDKYIPWFNMKYKGGVVKITIEQLLHHTSGIPFKSIGDIPASSDNGALEKTVRYLVGKELESYPGDKYSYATINYDILGLIIQRVTGQTFEDFMKNNVLLPLGLKNTYLFRNEALSHDMAAGYKVGFLRPMEYNAPMYRGNTPAGYFITNAEDMGQWLKVQIGTADYSTFKKSIIDESHKTTSIVAANYARGWTVLYDRGIEINHGGANPNFSSFIAFRPEDKIGVAVLLNRGQVDKGYEGWIGQGIMDILQGKEPSVPSHEFYLSIDSISVIIICIMIPIIIICVWFIFVLIFEVFKGKRKYAGIGIKSFTKLFLLGLFSAGIGYCLYNAPNVLFWGLSWDFIKVWAPESLIFMFLSIFIAVVVFCLYFCLTSIFIKPNDKSYFNIILLSIVSGFGNACIIFIINEALNRVGNGNGFEAELGTYFIMSIIIYVFGQKIVRTRLTNITDNLVYSKRVEIIEKILNTSYYKIEEIGNEKIYASLNNDTETVSNFANILVSIVTSLITLICCFIYLGMMNILGLVISIIVIIIAACVYFVMGKSANMLWEETRDIQNIFFKFINALVSGFKELSLNYLKRSEFGKEMQESCDTYRKKHIQGSLKFVNANVVGELLFTFVIGVTAFIFPVLFTETNDSTLRSYIFVFLYMLGPFHAIMDNIPSVMRTRISWGRINEMVKQLSSIEMDHQKSEGVIRYESHVNICVKRLEFEYKNEYGERFAIGPIDADFKSGEIIFITGGNGSGKSTIAKLITGLYAYDKGDILVNSKKISCERIGELFSAIFSDYYVFDKLYGISHEHKKKDIEEYLKKLQIDDKIQILDGIFSTTKLSSGQRKRLALIVAYLEDRPVYLFDEWAADQDPEFKKFFYYTLLPELKSRGKCVIAITHDDRYFNTADKIIKMERGKMIEYKINDMHIKGSTIA